MRTVEIAQANFKDVTSDYASIGLLSVLEPLLGVTSCTLPLLRPIFRLLVEKFGGKGKCTGVTSNRPSFLQSIQSIGSKRTRAKGHDPYPLDTILNTNNTYIDSKGKDQINGDCESVTNLVQNAQGSSTIHVKTHWNVDYGQG